MGVKDLFDKGLSLKSLKNKTRDSFREDLESARYVEAYTKYKQRYIPDTDFTTASSFAHFGLAELYYESAIQRIYQTYPYDGSLAEKLEWHNNSTYVDLFIFENEYPRTNGFVTFNSSSHTYTSTSHAGIYSSSAPQYIYFTGGPHADPGGDYTSDFSAGPSKKGISKANIYHAGSQRTNNLEIDPVKGLTIEFWMKKDGWATPPDGDPAAEYIFNISSTGSSGDTYGNLAIYTRKTFPTELIFVVVSGSVLTSVTAETGITEGPEGGLADSKWHHYAFALKRHNANNVTNFYVDGAHKSQHVDTSPANAIDGTLIASIGALAGPRGKDTPAQGRGWGNITSTSFDEFRYWKAERTAQQIGRHFRDQVGGGTNTDDIKYDDVSNFVDLGVYYKFNEGITGNSTTDATILDYSGRISNGTFINYDSATSRNTGSAIVLASAASKEFKDPIIYSDHPSVSAFLTAKKLSGSMHDFNNPSSLYRSLPGWILEEDEEKSNHLKYLTQIMASFFDDLYIQIQNLPKLKNINFPFDKNYEKALPFADRLLSSHGYNAPEIFADASALAQFLQRDEKKLFEKKLYDIKNTIYQNIYNNLSYIQKSKGTLKSLRNFLRCFGVGEELIKLNIYASGETYELKDNFTNTALRKKYLDFDDPETRRADTGYYTNSYTATAYQYYDPSDSNSISYIPGLTGSMLSGAAMTLEAEIFFPKRFLNDDINNTHFPGSKASLFGIHACLADNEDLSFASDDTINFNIAADKTNTGDVRDARFILESTNNSASDIFSTIKSPNAISGTYDNEKWTLAFRLKPHKYPLANFASGSLKMASGAPELGAEYIYELCGASYASNILQDEFYVSGTISYANAEKFFTQPKRIFAGANRTNFTGDVIRHSDVKISSVRCWLDYLPNEVIRAHAKNANTYGTLNPYKNSNFALNYENLFDVRIPEIETLMLNWTMDNVTGSDASGRFLIEDYTSGSVSDRNIKRYKWPTDVLKYNYTGRGDYFISGSTYRDQAVDIEFVQTAKQKLPEVVNSDDMVKILNKQDDIVFTRDTTYIQHFLSVEKSMYQTISEEMLRLFATIIGFNNLIGDPVNRYRPDYKDMEKLRDLFFDKVENEPDLDKFLDYYRWIDDAVTMMIYQLVPASANTSKLLRNMVESHILERNKYCMKFPTLEVKQPDLIGNFVGVNELKYNWKFGHAPLPSSPLPQDEKCFWWKERAERGGHLASGVASVDNEREELLKIAITEVSGTKPTLQTFGGVKYKDSYYRYRKFGKPTVLEANRSLKFLGGSNPEYNNINDFYRGVIKWGSDDDFIYIDLDNEINEVVCNDAYTPPELNKKIFNINALTMRAGETTGSNAFGTGAEQVDTLADFTGKTKARLLLPFSIYTSSIDTGYQSLYADQFKINFANLHDDKYGSSYEVPMQSPFTEKNVGGMQFRHTDLNRHDSITNKNNINNLDAPLTRPEGWHLQEFLNKETGYGRIINEYFTNATSTATTSTTILNLPLGSTTDDPGEEEYWRNGVAADNEWTFLEGSTPTAGTGPSSGNYAYCEVLPSKVGQTFGLVTPLIDMLDNDSEIRLNFRYHMFGLHMGNLKVQLCTDRDFASGIEDVLIISGQQHISAGSSLEGSTALIDSAGTSSPSGFGISGTGTLANFKNKRFYVRFLYTAGITHLGDCAIDTVQIYKSDAAFTPGYNQNSFKLLHPTYDNHHRPFATLSREEFAKRPVNIRNIQTTGSSPTRAGNFLERYEYVSTMSPESNDPWLTKFSDQVVSSVAENNFISSIAQILTSSAASIEFGAGDGLGPRTDNALDFTLPNRSFISGTIEENKYAVKNRTRFKYRFSSPGSHDVLSRGYLDPAHETYSVYNAMPWRNSWVRKVHNSQLTPHQGQYGVSTHRAAATASAVSILNLASHAISDQVNITVPLHTGGNGQTYTIMFEAVDATGDWSASAYRLVVGESTGPSDGTVAETLVDMINGYTGTGNGTYGHDFAASGDVAGVGIPGVTATLQGTTGITLAANNPGSAGNSIIVTNVAGDISSGELTGGHDSTARVYGSESAALINTGDYTVTGDASAQKFHRNNTERIEYHGDYATSPNATFLTASLFDNAYVSHMIPRTDNQTRWITASLI